MDTNQADVINSYEEAGNEVVDNLDHSPSIGDIDDPNPNHIVTQNSKEFDLNHFKQFTKRVECCNRVQDKKLNTKDHGSWFKGKGLIYIDFNAGMFEAIKKNMMRILKKTFGVKMVKQPKIEYYGAAEECINLDLDIALNGQTKR